MSARLVVLVSGAGTNLQALLDACADPPTAPTWPPWAPTASASRAWHAPSGPECRRSSSASADHATRDEWDAALTEAVDRYAPTWSSRPAS